MLFATWGRPDERNRVAVCGGVSLTRTPTPENGSAPTKCNAIHVMHGAESVSTYAPIPEAEASNQPFHVEELRTKLHLLDRC